MMQKIMSKEPVIVPDGNGGIRERFLVEVAGNRGYNWHTLQA